MDNQQEDSVNSMESRDGGALCSSNDGEELSRASDPKMMTNTNPARECLEPTSGTRVDNLKEIVMTEESIKTVGTPAMSVAPRSAAELAEAVLGNIEWKTPTEGFCECPGRAKHSTKDGAKDCKVYLNKRAAVTCLHGSCREQVKEAGRKLRRAIKDECPPAARTEQHLTAEERARIKEAKRLKSLRLRAASAKEQILTQNRWTYAEMQAASPAVLSADASDHWKLLLGQFSDGDVVWIGDKFDSGKPENAKNFRSTGEWLQVDAAPAQFICPVAFKPGSYSRSNENVVARRFLVVESDVLGKDEVGAVFRWLKEKMQLDLVAIVDTAGKSLHAWFQYPEEARVVELKVVLPELGCDPKLFTASQPVRLPGAMRDGKPQRLVYLAGKEVRS
jgi:hypothetical protein